MNDLFISMVFNGFMICGLGAVMGWVYGHAIKLFKIIAG